MEDNKKIKGIIIAIIFILVLFWGIVILYVLNKGEGDNDKEASNIGTSFFINNAFEEVQEKVFNQYCADWENMVFSLNGKKYTWPISYAQLIEDGFCIMKNEDMEIPDNPFKDNCFMYHKDNPNFYFIVNFKGEAGDDLEDALVEHMTLLNNDIVVSNKIILGNGITIGSSYDEVVSLMGEPDEKGNVYGDNKFKYYVKYVTKDGLKTVELRFSDIGVERVEIKELEMPIPEEKEFGFSTNDWTSFEVAIDGKIYTWPISYSQLVDNGFVIKKDESIDYERIEEKHDTWGHTMYNRDQTVFISIAFDGYVMPDYEATDCHTYTLSVVKGFTKDYDDFVLCNGIKLDDHYNDVVAAMGEEKEKSYYEGSGAARFSVSYENDKNSRKINFTFVDNRLERIEMYDLK